MALSLRQKLALTSLLIYWPAIFILTHIPVPNLVHRLGISDKIAHFLIYLILVFLFWFTVSYKKKASCFRITAWWVFLVMVCYGIADEVIQQFVGRGADLADLAADVAGVLVGLILLSIFSFWSAALVVTGTAIFLLTNMTQVSPNELAPVINAAFYLCAYVFFSLLWIQCMHNILPIRPPEFKWLIGALALPTFLLLAVEVFSAAVGNGINLSSILCAVVAIAITAGAISLIALCSTCREGKKINPKPG